MPIHVLIEGPQEVDSTPMFRVCLFHDKKGHFGKEYLVKEELLARDLAERMSKDRRLPLLDRTNLKPATRS